MMTPDIPVTHEVTYRRSIGAYLLGALELDESMRLEAHMRTCEPCHTELLEVGGVLADLALLTPGEAAAGALHPGRESIVVEPALASVLAPVGAPPAGSRRSRSLRARALVPGFQRRLVAAAAAAAAVVAAGGVGFMAGDRSDSPPVASAGAEATKQPPGSRTVAGRGIVEPVAGQAVLVPKSWGTEIEMTVSGTQRAVGPGVQCKLVIISTTGARDSIGTWVVPIKSPTPTGEHFTIPTSVRIDELAQLLVVTADGREVLAVHV